MKTTTMNNIEKFNNGLSIHQLEDRYEMVAAGGRGKGCHHENGCDHNDNNIELIIE
tara:strand:- start:3954 stop:4121 length:168 start_codon:yes stop_codon:yes gene_type:complete